MATVKEAKMYLQQVYKAAEILKQCDADLIELRATSQGLVTSYSIGGHSSQPSDMSGFISKLMEEEYRIEKYKVQWLEKRIEVKRFIQGLQLMPEQEHLRTLLIYRYVSLKDWAEIACLMHYSYRHIIKCLHPAALKAAAKELIIY